MPVREKPQGCCAPRAVKPLAKKRKAGLAKVAKALADPTRIEILRLLDHQAGAVCACDVLDHVNLSQPTVSHHLKILKEAGLLRVTRQGLWSFYEVDPAAPEVLGRLTGLVKGSAPS